MSKTHHEIPTRHFNRATLRILTKMGITIIGATWAPDHNGNYANGQTVYNLDDNGTHRVRTFLHVLAIAEGTLHASDERAHAIKAWRPAVQS